MPKMALHVPFGHFQPKLWAKERPGVKLVIWLPSTKSQESTFSRRMLKEDNMALKSSQRKLQLWFRLHSNWRLEPGNMSSQSPRIPTRDSFETPPWESREKEPFECSLHQKLQRILYGGRWWLPPSPGRGESSVTHSQAPCWTHLRVQLCRVAKSWDLRVALDFQR
jgi:hypothetical protein